MYLPGSPTLLHTDWGTMYTCPAMFCRLAYCGEGKVIVTLSPEELTLLIARPVVLASGYFLSIW